MPVDVLTLWKHLDETRRIRAAEALYADEGLKEFSAAADAYIGRSKNFRPQFVKKLPVEKRAHYLAQMPISAELAAQLLVSYHFAHQRPMMTTFLDAIGVPNDQGLIKDDAEVGPPTAEAITQAGKELLGKFPKDDVEVYFSTLISQNPEAWDGLEQFAGLVSK